MKRAALTVLVLILGMLMQVGVAHAQSDDDVKAGGETQTAEVKGGSASCTPNETLSSIECEVRDTAADKASIYVAWEAPGGQSGRFQNHQGSDTQESFEQDNIARGVDASTLRWKVCRDKFFRADECSDWKMHAVGPNGTSIDVYCESSESESVCYLPNRGLDADRISPECLSEIAGVAVGVGAGGLPEKVAKGVLKFIPGLGWILAFKDGSQVAVNCI